MSFEKEWESLLGLLALLKNENQVLMGKTNKQKHWQNPSHQIVFQRDCPYEILIVDWKQLVVLINQFYLKLKC